MEAPPGASVVVPVASLGMHGAVRPRDKDVFRGVREHRHSDTPDKGSAPLMLSCRGPSFLLLAVLGSFAPGMRATGLGAVLLCS